MLRRILLMTGILIVPVLLALAGGLLAAPVGPPGIDQRPVRLTAGPDGQPAPALEPSPVPGSTNPGTTSPGTSPSPPPAKPTPPPSGEPPAAPVLPPVVIADDDADDADDVDD